MFLSKAKHQHFDLLVKVSKLQNHLLHIQNVVAELLYSGNGGQIDNSLVLFSLPILTLSNLTLDQLLELLLIVSLSSQNKFFVCFLAPDTQKFGLRQDRYISLKIALQHSNCKS